MPKRARTKSKSVKRYRAAKKSRTMWARPSPWNRVGRMSVLGAPTGMRVKMKYAASIDLSSGVANYVEHVFRAYSIFDPDFTGIGHQPLGHDQWQNLYARYRVLGSSISVDYALGTYPASGAFLPCEVTLALTEASAGIAVNDTVKEMPVSKRATMAGGDGSKRLAIGYAPSYQIQGNKGAIYEQDYAANFGSNPVRDAFYHIVASTPGSATVSCRANVVIIYDVWLHDPIDLTQS